MSEKENEQEEMEQIKLLIEEGKIDPAVEKITYYLNQSTEENYLERLENTIETISTLHGGRTVIRFLIEHMIIDIPSLLENLSKKDPLLRYSFLLLLKDICETEGDLFLPYSENLLNSEDPNVREANLQLLIFLAGGDKLNKEQETLIKLIASKLNDDKDFVIEKAIQVLKTIGKNEPSLITRILSEFVKECPDNEELKSKIDIILKSIVTIEKIEEIVEDEELKKEISEEKEEKEREKLKDEKQELKDEEIEIKKKEIELEKKKLEFEKEKLQIIEKEIKKKEQEILEQESKDA